jgi:hypothetical protein
MATDALDHRLGSPDAGRWWVYVTPIFAEATQCLREDAECNIAARAVTNDPQPHTTHVHELVSTGRRGFRGSRRRK